MSNDAKGHHMAGNRPEVRAFADAMEAQLRANDHKPGWAQDHPEDLLVRLLEEVEELREVVKRHVYQARATAGMRSVGEIPFSLLDDDTEDAILGEAADVANFAMMIADVCGALRGNDVQ